MKKLKKSLAVLLAVLMLASFTPLFASAATITLNTSNVIILEAPKITYGDQVEVNKITVNYGVAPKDLTVTGGKLGYIASEGATPVEVPGTFSGSTSLKLSVGDDVTIGLKFTPDDTTTYSSPTIRNTYTMAEGVTWPSAKVIGLATTFVEAPTAAEILVGQRLSSATLSGGKVTDADGVELTGGRWRFVDTSIAPAASGEFEVQWTKTGYDTVKTTVNVTVNSYGDAVLVENPVAKRKQIGSTLNNTSLVGGKVTDKDGNEITTGYWSVVLDDNQTNVTYDTAGTYNIRVKWNANGYSNTIETTIPVTVGEGLGYEITTAPSLDNNRFLKDRGTMTYADLKVTAGEATVPGTFAIKSTELSTSIATIFRTYTATVVFTPDDISLYSTSTSVKFKVLPYDGWEIPEMLDKIVVPYGFSYQSKSYSSYNSDPKDIEIYNAGIQSVSWNLTDPDFHAENLEVGEIQKVKVKVTPRDNMWEAKETEIYIQIEPRVYENDFCTINVMNPDEITGETIVNIRCEIPGIAGDVLVKVNGETFATLKPDENGYIYERLYYTPEADGTYTFSATYVPSILDKTTVTVTEVTGRTVDIDRLQLRKLTIYVANQKFEYDVYETHSFARSWSEFSMETPADVFEYWLVTDGNGNEVTVESLDTSKHNLQFNMPEHDLVLTAKGAIEDTVASDGSLGSTLWGFWQRFVNFIVEIYRTIMDFFVPAVEQY